MSLPRLTSAIIHLQATQPEMKAAMKPAMRGSMAMSPPMASPFIILMASSNASPNMGGMTMRNENWAMAALLLPSMRPVAMVVPERLRPGSTARAWLTPMMKAWRGLMLWRWRGRAR